MGTRFRIAPIFPVRDLDLAMEHYRRLGFAVRRYPPGGYGFASRDGVEIHFGVVADTDHQTGAASAKVVELGSLGGMCASRSGLQPARVTGIYRFGTGLGPDRGRTVQHLSRRPRSGTGVHDPRASPTMRPPGIGSRGGCRS